MAITNPKCWPRMTENEQLNRTVNWTRKLNGGTIRAGSLSVTAEPAGLTVTSPIIVSNVKTRAKLNGTPGVYRVFHKVTKDETGEPFEVEVEQTVVAGGAH